MQLPTSAQNTNPDKTIYFGKSFKLNLLDDSGEVATSKPIGKNPMVTYDKFFLSYTIVYETENGGLSISHLKYISTDKSGMLRMKDDYDKMCLVTDKIAEFGKLIFVYEVKAGDYMAMCIIEGLELEK